MNRTKTTTFNSITAISSLLITYLSQFFYRTFLIKGLGVQYAGLTGLFGNIISLFSLAELGISTAIMISLYKPLQEQDYEKTSSLIYLIKKIYKYIGFIILFIGLLSLPFLRFIVNEKIKYENIYVIFLLCLFNTVLSYFFHSYYQVLISADRKEYKFILPRTVIPILIAIIQIISINIFKNFRLVLICNIIGTLILNYWVMLKVKKLYPEINISLKDKYLTLNEKKYLKNYVKATLNYKISEKIFYSTDPIIISSFLGITTMGIFSNYCLVIDTIKSLILSLFGPFTSAIGNLNVSTTTNYKKIVFDRLNFFNFWITSFCTVNLYILINPFIEIWLGDKYILEKSVIIILMANFYSEFMLNFVMKFREGCGLNIKGRYRPLISAIINIVLSLLFVRTLGLFGIILGTFISRMSTIFLYEPYLIYKYVFNKSPYQYYVNYLLNTIIFIIILLLTNYLFYLIWQHTILSFFYGFVLCLIIPNLIYWIIFNKNDNYIYYKKYFYSLKKDFN